MLAPMFVVSFRREITHPCHHGQPTVPAWQTSADREMVNFGISRIAETLRRRVVQWYKPMTWLVTEGQRNEAQPSLAF